MTEMDDQIMQWINQKLSEGKTRKQLHGTVFIKDSKIITIKTSGKSKWNLHVFVGAIKL